MIRREYASLEELFKYYETYTKQKTDHLLFDRYTFTNKLIKNKIVFTSYKATEINGFLSAVKQDDKVYITLVYGEMKVQEQLIYSLKQVAQTLEAKELWFHFFNPVHIPWFVKKGVTHPSIQGIEYQSECHHMLHNNGFIDHSIQETYYLDLSKYQTITKDTLDPSITFERYDKNKHVGFYKFLKELQAPHWQKYLMENDSSEHPLPVLVATDQNHVIGFAGPLKVETLGRGYFGGIGVLQSYRGRKIGKYLFHSLCQTLKEMDAQYMTLFTGTNNVGKYVYLGAGCTVEKQFITLKKQLTE